MEDFTSRVQVDSPFREFQTNATALESFMVDIADCFMFGNIDERIYFFDEYHGRIEGFKTVWIFDVQTGVSWRADIQTDGEGQILKEQFMTAAAFVLPAVIVEKFFDIVKYDEFDLPIGDSDSFEDEEFDE
jgi:hypothetical protein